MTSYVANANLEAAPIADGAVLYNAKTSRFVMLNRSAERLWSELSTPKTQDELVLGLCRTYPGIKASTVQSAVSDALEHLRRLELVQPGSGSDGGVPVPVAEVREAERRADWAPPSVRELDEDDLLKVFQMTAAEISVALCWWGACTHGCP